MVPSLRRRHLTFSQIILLSEIKFMALGGGREIGTIASIMALMVMEF